MPIISFSEIGNKIQAHDSGIFAIAGDEDFLINEALNLFTQNKNKCIIFNGENCKIKDVLTTYTQGNIFETQSIIILNDADNCKDLTNNDFISKLDMFLQKNKNGNILLFVYKKKLLKTSTLYKLFLKHNLFIANKLTTQQIIEQIRQYCKNNNIKIDDDNIRTLVDSGDDINNIIKKISILDKSYNTIDKNILTDIMPIQKNFDIFEFMMALANKNFTKINIISKNFFTCSSAEIIPLLGLLYSFFLKTLIYKHTGSNMPFFYKIAAKNYTENKLLRILQELEYNDKNIKGFSNTNIKPCNYLYSILTLL